MALEKINQLTITNWRSWKGENILDQFDDGFIILGGPNAIGKSGVWEAIVNGLLDKHRGKHTERLRPIGTSGLIPQVEIEFTADGIDYKIFKRFCNQQASSGANLYEKEGNKWSEKSEGDEAYIQCRRIVAGADTIDSTRARGGLDNALKDTLMQVLLPVQGSLTALSTAPPGIKSLGIDEASAKSATQIDIILSKVSKDMDMWNKGRTTFVKSELKSDIENLENIRLQITNLEKEASDIDDYVNRIRQISEDLEDIDDATKHLEQANILDEEAEVHRKLREDAKEAVDNEELSFDTISEICKSRQKQLDQLDDLNNKIDVLNNNISQSEDDFQKQNDSFQQLSDKDASLKKDSNILNDWIKYTERESKIENLVAELSQQNKRLEKLDNAQLKQDGLVEKKGNLLLPDKTGWKKWDKLDSKLKHAKGKKDVKPWSISGSLPKGYRIIIDDDKISNSNISGVASSKIEISSPDRKHNLLFKAPDSDSKAYDKIVDSIKEFFDEYGVENIDELRSRNSDANNLDVEISGVKSQKSLILGDDNRDIIVEGIGKLKGDLNKYEDMTPPTSAKPEGTVTEWKIRYELLYNERESIQKQLQKQAKHTSKLETELNAIRKKFNKKSEEREIINETLSKHRKDFNSDNDILAEYRELESISKECVDEWMKLEKERGPAEDQKLKSSKKLKKLLKDLIGTQGEIKTLEGNLEHLRKEDPEGQLAIKRSEFTRIEQKIHSEKIHADALLLLENTLISNLNKHTEAIGGPIKETIQSWLQYVLQDDSEIHVNEDGLPEVIRSPTSQDIPFEEQSFGTKEQISVLYRLAIAKLVSENSNSGVCLMLDDPFGYTDKGRRERMLEIIENEVDNLGHQVLLFTCRPEDFTAHGINYPIIGNS